MPSDDLQALIDEATLSAKNEIRQGFMGNIG
jgi:hypothetical protein